jgi:hypothetical protein
MTTIMKTKICLFSVLLAFNVPAWAALYSFGTLHGDSALGPILDNNTIGLTESFTAGSLDVSISALTLTVELQGGASTDLSTYLRLGNTDSSPSYNLTSLIQGQSLSSGSPTTYTVDFGTPAFQSAFNGQNPNNTWTLFFADTRAGDQTTLNGWSWDITAVPEPVNVALGVFGGLFAVVGLVRIVRRVKA